MRDDGGHYTVVRTLGGAGYTDVALVLTHRSERHHRLGRRRHDDPDTVVLHHRAFRPLTDLAELEAYAAQLERAAAHGEQGSLWYFVTTRARPGGKVEVSLFDRWFDGRHVRCEQRAHREFDSADDAGASAAVDFTAGLQAWAEQQNDAREARCREVGGDEVLEAEQSAQAASAAAELAALLAEISR